ncbi:MAG: acyl-CoA dehydrogenase [Gammaproteobacteria bacterium]
MASESLNPRDLEFILYEFLDAEALCRYPRYAEHNRATFDAVLASARQIAAHHFAPHNRKADLNEPRLVNGKVEIIPEVKQALAHFAAAGFLAAHHDYAWGGVQLPWVVTQAAFAQFSAANIATAAYPFLTIAAANLLRRFGDAEQQRLYMAPMLDGRFFGTMALSEPQAGSSLADVRTRAIPQQDGSFAIQGVKMWTSGGEHELCANIVHLLLARIQGASAGVKGLSLFVVPRYRVNPDGTLGVANDVTLAGLNHKMGYRGAVNTLLAFGDHERCQGWLVGAPNQGLAIMFQMMNEARIGVGLGAAALGCAGYTQALDYARQRPQGRLPDNKDPEAPPVLLVEHADVKRMLLASKAYVEGSLALALYAALLVDKQHHTETASEREETALLLDLLTPVIKAWGSEACLKANDYAIQILGGYGYTRDFLVEQLYRDNRLNPIHEGANGIQAIDLLGRKVAARDGAAIKLLHREIRATVAEAKWCLDDGLRQAVRYAADRLESTTLALLKSRATVGANVALANASLYMDLFGRVVLAWIWLKQAAIARRRLLAGDPLDPAEIAFYRGKLKACQYFIDWELPQTEQQAALLRNLDTTCLDMEPAWF